MFQALFGKNTGKIAAPILSEPIRLSNGALTFEVGTSTRREIERKVKPPIAYPAAGWHTWTTPGGHGEIWILSAFYRRDVLIAVEHYLAKTDRLPKYAPRITGGFRLVPDEISLGSKLGAVPAHFIPGSGALGGVGTVVFQALFAARWPAGIAIVSGNDARIERLALYANVG